MTDVTMDFSEWLSIIPEAFRQRLQLVREFEGGVQGRVFLCEDLVLRRRVVLKMAIVPEDGDVTSTQRFEDEVRLLSALSHPHIVRLFDGQATGSDLYLITEFIDGPTLQVQVDQRGPVAMAPAIKHLLDICDGLEAAHQAGVVHRDLKPKNILLDPSRGPVIIDFGLARSEHADRAITSQGDVVGTPLYMAPEVIMGRPATISSDIYAVGLILHFMLNGKHAFSRGELTGVLEAQVHEPTPRLTNVPAALQELLDRCVAKVAADRPQSCSELVRAIVPVVVATRDLDEVRAHPVMLKHLSGVHDSLAARAPSPARGRGRDVRRRVFTGAGLAAATVTLFAAGFRLGRDEEAGPAPVQTLRVTPGVPGQVTVSGTCLPCDAVRIQVDDRAPIPAAVRSGSFQEALEIDPFDERSVIEITSIHQGTPGPAVRHEIKIAEMSRSWRQILISSLSRTAGKILPMVQHGLTPTILSEVRKDLQELSILSKTSSIHLLEKYLQDSREPVEERLAVLRQISALLEALAVLATVNVEMPDWERPLWIFPVRFQLERPFNPRKRAKQDLADPHLLTTGSSMLRFDDGEYTTEISCDLVLKKLPSRAMLVLEIYKFPRDIALEVALNGHALPRCVMRTEWRGHSDDGKTRHHLELLPGLIREGPNRVVITRRGEDESRSLEPVNVSEISLQYDP